jgi:hypothetical protein
MISDDKDGSSIRKPTPEEEFEGWKVDQRQLADKVADDAFKARMKKGMKTETFKLDIPPDESRPGAPVKAKRPNPQNPPSTY